MLNPASNEQLHAIELLKIGHVKIDAVAGSGKTTTIIHSAIEFTDDTLLVLTYSARLRVETRTRTELLNLTNIDVHSYHSFINKYYTKCYNDNHILDVIKTDIIPKAYEYSIIIIDEIQDLRPDLFVIVKKIIKYNKTKKQVRLCILGDKHQCIYDYNGSSSSFLIYADQLFNINEFVWNTAQLSTSFRVTKQIADFININVLKYKRIYSEKPGAKPHYIICNSFTDVPFKTIQYYLTMYSPEQIFILAPSIKSITTPVRILANKLSKLNINIFVPLNDEERIDADIIRGKIAFSSFHQAKGLERPVVFIFGFDNSYFNFYNKTAERMLCPNTLYVAITRASEHLILFHHNKNDYLPFLNTSSIKETCNFHKSRMNIKELDYTKPIKNTVTNLIKFLPANIINAVLSNVVFNCIQKKEDRIPIPTKTEQNDLFENVSEITGTAIPAYYEFLMTGEMHIWNAVSLDKNKSEKDKSEKDKSEIHIYFADENTPVPANLLKLANEYCAKCNGYKYKLVQIQDYNWLTMEHLNLACDRLSIISKDAKYEVLLSTESTESKNNTITITGEIDCIDGDIIYEFKCVDELNTIHKLQLAIYAYIYEAAFHKKMKYRLFNILDNEIYELESSFADLQLMFDQIIDHKYYIKTSEDESDFILKMNAL